MAIVRFAWQNGTDPAFDSVPDAVDGELGTASMIASDRRGVWERSIVASERCWVM